MRSVGVVNPSEPFVFAVRHRAAPQGSKDLRTKANGAKYMKESSDRVRPFRNAVRLAALGVDGLPRAKFTGPVAVSIEFEFLRAPSNTDDFPVGQNIGDLDKLTRAVLDALTQAEVIEDDKHVVRLHEITKTWGPEDRVIISVSQHPAPSTTQAIVDFAKQIGQPLAAWQEYALDNIPKTRNPFE